MAQQAFIAVAVWLVMAALTVLAVTVTWKMAQRAVRREQTRKDAEAEQARLEQVP